MDKLKLVLSPSLDRVGVSVIPVTPFQQNCSLVWCRQSGMGVVIDPGGDLDLVLAEAVRSDVSVRSIYLTHGHLDHAGAAELLSAMTGAPIFGPAIDDRFLLERLPSITDQTWLDRVRWLSDGDRLSVGDLSFDVRHCPGHTPGHVAFVQQESRMAWVGDLLFAGSIGNTDMAYSNLSQLIQSIVGRLWPFGDDIRFIPGHGRTSTFGAERILNPYVSDLVVELLDLNI